MLSCAESSAPSDLKGKLASSALVTGSAFSAQTHHTTWNYKRLTMETSGRK